MKYIKKVTFILLICLAVIAAGLIYYLRYYIVYGYGQHIQYYGQNELGNRLKIYGLYKTNNITAESLRAFSVQNTKNGNYAIARATLDRAMELDPEPISRYYGWLLLYYYRDYEKALNVLNFHDNFTPNFSDEPMGENVHYLKGLAFMQLDSLDSAIKEFDIYIEELLTTHGEEWINIYALVNKGRVLYKQNRFNEAISIFKMAIKNYKDCTEAYYNIGLCYSALKEYEKSCTNLYHAESLIDRNIKSSDIYVELFHEIYKQDIVNAINQNCIDIE